MFKEEFFKRPDDLVVGSGTTVKDSGHIFGYLALFEARLIGGGSRNISPPRNSSYDYANAFQTKVDSGEIIRTGVISMAGGHHEFGALQDMQNAYADVSRQLARVVYGEDSHGVWFSGQLVDNNETNRGFARGSGISGHWEPPAPNQSPVLIGSCLVNIPGFPQRALPNRIVASATATSNGGFTITNTIQKVGLKKMKVNVKNSGRITASGLKTYPISGLLLSLNKETSDGRIVRSYDNESLPLPLWSKDVKGGFGHDGATVVGRIDNIWSDGDDVSFEGVLLADTPEAAKLIGVAELGLLGVSIDATGEGLESDDGSIEFDSLTIFGATLTTEPAFSETVGVTVGDHDEVAASLVTPKDSVELEDDSDETVETTKNNEDSVQAEDDKSDDSVEELDIKDESSENSFTQNLLNAITWS